MKYVDDKCTMTVFLGVVEIVVTLCDPMNFSYLFWILYRYLYPTDYETVNHTYWSFSIIKKVAKKNVVAPLTNT